MNNMFGTHYPGPENMVPQDMSDWTVADGILVTAPFHFPVAHVGTEYDLHIASGPVVPTTANCQIPVPAFFIQEDAASPKMYVAIGTRGALCTGWAALN